MLPAQDLGQAVSSVNSYCTIILEYLVVRDFNFISVKLRCLHLTLSSAILVRGDRGKLVYLGLSRRPPPPAKMQDVILVRRVCVCGGGGGWGCKLSRLVYLAPRPGFRSCNVVSQFLLHHNLGIFSCKRYEHYFIQTGVFTSNVQFGYPCPRGGRQSVWLVYLAPPPPPSPPRILFKQCHQFILIAP